jgi:iron(III) transport system ATP-binding protein
VAELLELTGLEGLGRRFPHELSGGQRQRVALARALAPGPELVLLDEPWNAVDPLLRSSLRDEVVRILRGMDVTVLLVTHDREEAFPLADRIAIMRSGKVVQAGVPEDLYFAPADRWCAGFVGPSNLVRGRAAEGVIATPVGTFPSNGAKGAVDVMVRPELLELEPDQAAPAEVVDRKFLGHDVLYRVRLADGSVLASQRPSNEVVPLGARVNVRVHEGRVAVFRA